MRLRQYFLFTVVLASLAGSYSYAKSDNNLDSSTMSIADRYFTLGEVTIEKVNEDNDWPGFKSYSYANDCSQLEEDTNMYPQNEAAVNAIDISQVIRIGKEVWQIVSDNKPVVEMKSQVAHALPRGIPCWLDLESWEAPKTALYRVTYKNLLGATVTEFQYRVIYGYGGSVNNAGQFLANVTMVPAKLDVAWGFKFDANVRVGQVLNLGTKEDPKAGMEIQLNWRVRSLVSDRQETVSFFVQGDGKLIPLQ